MLDDGVLNNLKLAKMYESLLRTSSNNRQENFDKYRNIVVEIDKNIISVFLEMLNSFDDHNQTLEEELRFLIQVKNHFNKISELQVNFKNVCELYGYKNIELYDLKQIDIGYINNRIEVIEKYLDNLRNIDVGEKQLQKLSDDLLTEERSKVSLSKKLLEYENLLVESFERAEGRLVVDGQLEYISVVSEYKNLGFEFKTLINDEGQIQELLSVVNKENVDIEEKRKAAELCYNANPTLDSKQIIDDINKDFFNIRYKLTMLKILDLLVKKYDEYELFREKREKLFDLIKYRFICLKKLGKHISIDPFARTKVSEQMESLSSLDNNSKKISRIKKEISLLSSSIDEMVNQNEIFKIEIGERKSLIIDISNMNKIINSMDDTLDVLGSVLLPATSERKVLPNQVVSITSVPLNLNMTIVSQKTQSVLKRVASMINDHSDDLIIDASDKSSVVIPELVIVNPVETYENLFKINDNPSDNTDEVEPIEESILDFLEKEFSSSDVSINGVGVSDGNFIDASDKELDGDVKQVDDVADVDDVNNKALSFDYDDSIFKTVTPFDQIPMFFDKTDDGVPLNDNNVSQLSEIPLMDNGDQIVDDFVLNFDELEDGAMPDAFWVTHEDEKNDANDEKPVSFDEQIAALMESDDTKIKKLVA